MAVRRALKDGYGRVHTYLRMSLTERCSLRCVYCMPAEGVELPASGAQLRAEEIGRLTRIFASRGVTKVRLTGGEPLVRGDSVEIARMVAGVAGIESVGMTTNGLVLGRNLDALLQGGVRHLNISLDTLIPSRFEQLTRRKGLGRVVDAVERASADERAKVKLNVVVMRGVNDDEIVDFARWTQHRAIDVRFIEYMPFSGNAWAERRFLPYADMLQRLCETFGTLERVKDAPNDTSKHYRVSGYKGRVGFISSMSQHFCASCNRLRVTADGALKVCLFGVKEVSLRDAMRDGADDEQLHAIIDAALLGKHWALGGRRDRHELAASENRSMIRIGG